MQLSTSFESKHYDFEMELVYSAPWHGDEKECRG